MKKLLAVFMAAASLVAATSIAELNMCTNGSNVPGDAKPEKTEFEWSKDRAVWLYGNLVWEDGQKIIDRMVELEAADPGKEIELRLMSVGGNVSAGLAIIDVARTLQSDVRTVCLGQASSMAAMILVLAGTPGKRMATEECRIMIHQPSWEVTGDASMMEIRAKEMVQTKQRFIDLLVEATKLSREKLEHMIDRDTYLSAQEAKDMGMIDVIVPRSGARLNTRAAAVSATQPKP